MEQPGIPLETSSWDTALRVTVANPDLSTQDLRCTSIAFTMHVDQRGAGLGVVLGANGHVFGGGTLVPQGGGTYALAAPMNVPVGAGCNATPKASIKLLTVTASDSDHDGVPDRLTGSGAGTGTPRGTGLGITFSFTLTGTPDTTPPSLFTTGAVHPLEGIILPATEPLVPTDAMTLEGTTSMGLRPLQVVDGAIGALTAESIVPFGGTWSVEGHAEDLIGLPVAGGLTVSSLPDPGIFIEDGFEGEPPRAVNESGFDLVSHVGSLPALSGSRSMFVGLGARVTLHLKRPPGASTVRFNCRLLRKAAGAHWADGSIVTVGVIGGVTRLRPTLGQISGDTADTREPNWPLATPLEAVTITLPEPGDDVVLSIAPPGGCPGHTELCGAPPSILIDDVRVE